MDQKRLTMFIVIAIAILLVSQWLMPRPKPVLAPPGQSTQTVAEQKSGFNPAPQGSEPAHVTPPANVPRVTIDAPRVLGSFSLLGARLDDLRLRDYRETVDKNSPLVRLLEPQSDPQPSYIQFGWTAADGTKTPDGDTVWTSGGGNVGLGHPVVLTWDNGQGQTFHITLAIDANYEFTATQSVHNAGAAAVKLFPWQRLRRDYAPTTAGYAVLFEGLLGVMDNRLNTITYAKVKTEATKGTGGAPDSAYGHEGAGGWAGITDKYWLTALIPDQSVPVKTSWNHWLEGTADRFQVSYGTTNAETIAPGADTAFASRVYAGAKEVHLLDRYEVQEKIPLLSYAVDWGHLFFLTKPFFYVLDWLNSVIGNFGVAILLFTMGVKALFYPIAARSYASMGKMRLLGPKIAAVKERYKDDQAKQQSEMMAVYKAENVNPASGCLPMLIQIPVFFALYKDILCTIEMRHAPFFGWIHDLSATDPTNLFNLFGLIPFDPTSLSPMLHLGVWPVIMGATMYFQQKLNPPPPDPTQARMLQFMPLIFVFSMGRFPAGLVIYWSWNNALTIAQQWYIQKNQKLTKTRVVKA